MAIQFCKFQETLFRNIVVINEYYYQINAFFLLHPVHRGGPRNRATLNNFQRINLFGKYRETSKEL
jgi:hypothetical protein